MAAQTCTITGTVKDVNNANWTGVCYIKQVGDLSITNGEIKSYTSVVTAGAFTSTDVISPSDLEFTFVNTDGRIALRQTVQVADGQSAQTITQLFGGALLLPAASLTPASVYATPANPTATNDATGKMMGCAVAFTPKTTGKVMINVSGIIGSANAGFAAGVQITHGTGSAPVNGDALTGTAVGNIACTTAIADQVVKAPFSCSAIVTGLAVGTACWCDIRVNAISAGNATASNLAFTIIELA